MKKYKILMSLALTALMAFALEAQDLGGMIGDATGTAGKSQRDDEIPTVIEALRMDIDIANNIATLTGEVSVDDQEINLFCDKMIMYLEDKPKAESATGKPVAENATAPEDEAANKQLKRIECIGNVVIIRKQIDESTPEKQADEARKAQQAKAGKAEYDLSKGTIVLTEKPIVNMGQYTATGEEIEVRINEGYRTIISGKGSKIVAKGLKNENLTRGTATEGK